MPCMTEFVADKTIDYSLNYSYHNIMKNTIEKVLAEYAELQVNLGSESARKFLAEKIADELYDLDAKTLANGMEDRLAKKRAKTNLILPPTAHK